MIAWWRRQRWGLERGRLLARWSAAALRVERDPSPANLKAADAALDAVLAQQRLKP